MQTSLTSRIYSSSGKRTQPSKRGFTQPSKMAGFTLIELLISIAIIGTVTSIVLTKYGSFDSTALLKGLAYEIGLTLREAQVRSVSVARNEVGTFDYPYGVTFSLTSPKQYTSFRYEDASLLVDPKYGVSEAKDIRIFPIARTMKILDLCVVIGGLTDCNTIGRLDVSFRRPKFKGLFYTDIHTPAQAKTIESATIVVGTDNGTNRFVVKVTSLGQISVSKQ